MAKILVVEDDVQVRMTLGLALESMGHSVTLTGDGREAIGVYEPSFDLVVADIFMPRMNGIELMIRLHHEHPGIRLLVVSGGGRLEKEDILRDAAILGAATTLEKPFTLDELEEAVESALADGPSWTAAVHGAHLGPTTPGSA